MIENEIIDIPKKSREFGKWASIAKQVKSLPDGKAALIEKGDSKSNLSVFRAAVGAAMTRHGLTVSTAITESRIAVWERRNGAK